MKKFYVKPVATNVAFVVNENIATSKSPDESLTGMGSYSSVDKATCNEFFNSTQVKTYLQPGETSILQALKNVMLYDSVGANEILAKMDPDNPEGFNCY